MQEFAQRGSVEAGALAGLNLHLDAPSKNGGMHHHGAGVYCAHLLTPCCAKHMDTVILSNASEVWSKVLERRVLELFLSCKENRSSLLLR